MPEGVGFFYFSKVPKNFAPNYRKILLQIAEF